MKMKWSATRNSEIPAYLSWPTNTKTTTWQGHHKEIPSFKWGEGRGCSPCLLKYLQNLKLYNRGTVNIMPSLSQYLFYHMSIENTNGVLFTVLWNVARVKKYLLTEGTYKMWSKQFEVCLEGLLSRLECVIALYFLFVTKKLSMHCGLKSCNLLNYYGSAILLEAK